MQYEDLNQFLDSMESIKEENKIYIWGRSVFGNLLGMLFNRNKIKWDGYYDNFSDFDEKILNGKYTFKAEEIDDSEEAFYVLSMRKYMPVREQLLEKGIKPEHIICFDNILFFEHLEEEVLGNNVSTAQLRNFHDKHKGEKCFVIGNGPSLTIEDLDAICQSGFVSFASNMIFGCYDKTKWRPEYYFIIDGIGISETFRERKTLEYVAQNCQYFFSRSSSELAQWVQEIPNLILFKAVLSNLTGEFGFSSDCSEKVYTGYTVTYAMLQMAVYMGFKEIYLLGMDHSFSVERGKDGKVVEKKNVRNHSEIIKNDRLWGVSEIEEVTKAYMAAKAYADAHNVKIMNATRGGKLEVFERINIDQLFCEKKKL